MAGGRADIKHIGTRGHEAGGMGYCRFGVEEFTTIGKAVFGNINDTEYVRAIYVRTGRGHVAPTRQVPCGSGSPS